MNKKNIDSLWHKSDEIPKNLSQCLVEFINPDFDDEFLCYEVFTFGTINTGFIGFKKSYKLIRYICIRDLI